MGSACSSEKLDFDQPLSPAQPLQGGWLDSGEAPSLVPILSPTAGVYSTLPAPEYPNVAVIGLTGAGKTSFIQYIQEMGEEMGEERLGEPPHPLPTSSPPSSAVLAQWGQRLVHLWDTPGYLTFRKCWANFISAKSVSGVVMVLDSADPMRLPVAWMELRAVVRSQYVASSGIPVLCLLNKMDASCAATTSRLMAAVSSLPISHVQFCVAEVSTKTGSGLKKSLDWFTSTLPAPVKK